MKYFLFLLLIPQFVTAQVTLKEFKVTVDLSAVKNVEKIYLEYSNTSDPNNQEVKDSITSTNKIFTIKGRIAEPGYALIYRNTEYPKEILEQMKNMPGVTEEMKELFDGPMQDPFIFFLMPGKTTIISKGSLVSSTINGPQAVLDFEKLKKDKDAFLMKTFSFADKLIIGSGKADEAFKQKLLKKMDTANMRMKDQVYLSYFRTNPSSPLALYVLKEAMPVKQDSADKFIQLFSLLPSETQHWPSAIRFIASLKASKNAEIGQFVKDFKQFDSLGKAVSFSSFKGRYVLIDLWASWCIPCRTKHPELVSVYQKYSQENFSILGIALEQKDDKKKWLKAINVDKLLWAQVTDFKYWNNAVAQRFGVRSIPFNLLVDPNGKIIDKNLSPSDLENRLAELFKKKINTGTIAAANISDTLIYYYRDASVAPQYHRSYLIRVTPGQVYLAVDSYDQVILKDSFALTKAAYDSFTTALDDLHIKNKKEVESAPCVGGTSERLVLYPGTSREIKGYINYCGGMSSGSLEGDLKRATILFRAIVPDLYKRIEATRNGD